jgi:hypothetical protein
MMNQPAQELHLGLDTEVGVSSVKDPKAGDLVGDETAEIIVAKPTTRLI